MAKAKKSFEDVVYVLFAIIALSCVVAVFYQEMKNYGITPIIFLTGITILLRNGRKAISKSKASHKPQFIKEVKETIASNSNNETGKIAERAFSLMHLNQFLYNHLN
jgi:hypothetical protein